MTKEDVYISELRRHLTMCASLLEERAKRNERVPIGMTRRIHRINHTDAMYHLVQELRGMVEQDPDNWDDEPDIVPF